MWDKCHLVVGPSLPNRAPFGKDDDHQISVALRYLWRFWNQTESCVDKGTLGQHWQGIASGVGP